MGTAKWLVWCYTHYFKPAFTVGDMSSSCPLPTARFWCGCRSIQPFTFPRFANSDRWFEKPKGFSVWLATIVQCLRHFIRCNTNLTTTVFPSVATRHKICHPFGVPLMNVCLAVFFHAFGIFLFEMQTE